MKRSDPSSTDSGLNSEHVDMIFDDAVAEDDQKDAPDVPVVVAVGALDPEQWPNLILRGMAANLFALRQTSAYSTFFVGPRELHGSGAIPCRIQWHDGASSVGDIFITTSQVLFVSSGKRSTLADGDSDQDEDWAIGATCIHLHAMTDDPETSVYLQIQEAGSDDDSTLEVTLIPVVPGACQTLFDELCRLVSRHPLVLDDEEDGPGFGGGNFFMGGGEEDDLVWAPSAEFGTVIPDYDDDNEDFNYDDEGAATEAEREAMLERLDNLLVVRPEFDTEEGQFDDADEHGDGNDSQPSPQ